MEEMPLNATLSIVEYDNLKKRELVYDKNIYKLVGTKISHGEEKIVTFEFEIISPKSCVKKKIVVTSQYEKYRETNVYSYCEKEQKFTDFGNDFYIMYIDDTEHSFNCCCIN